MLALHLMTFQATSKSQTHFLVSLVFILSLKTQLLADKSSSDARGCQVLAQPFSKCQTLFSLWFGKCKAFGDYDEWLWIISVLFLHFWWLFVHKCVGNKCEWVLYINFLYFIHFMHIGSCTSELASHNDESSFQVICVCFSKCWFSTFHKHHTTVCLSFLLSSFNSVLVNTQWRRTTRQAPPKNWQWRAETWCSWSSRETMDSGEKTAKLSL